MASSSRTASVERPRRRAAVLLALGLTGALTLGLDATASATSLPSDTVVRVNNGTGGGATDDGAYAPAISGDGRYVAFRSPATDLVPGVADGLSHIYVTDTHTSITGIVSVATDGTVADGNSDAPTISLDGRYVSFSSNSTNLVDPGTTGHSDVYVRDTCAGESDCTPSTVLASAPIAGTHTNGPSAGGHLSGDGRYVLFGSDASDLVADDTNGRSDLFVRDTCLGIADCIPSTTRPTLTHDGEEPSSTSSPAGLSTDGRYIAFLSIAANLVPGDTNGMYDVFVRDTCTGAAACTPSTTRVSVADDGAEANGGSAEATISNDGRFVSFSSDASNLVVGDTNDTIDVFVRDTCAGASACTPSTHRISIASDRSEANDSSADPRISGEGRYVAFVSHASNLIPDDANGIADIFVHDTCLGSPGCSPTTTRVSLSRAGVETDRHSDAPSISAGGAHIAFHSYASALVSGPDTMQYNVYVASYYQPPVVISHPRSLTVTVGDTATLSFLLSANPLLGAFTWETAESADGPWTTTAVTYTPRLTVTPTEPGVVFYRALGQNFRGFLATNPVSITAARAATTSPADADDLAATGAETVPVVVLAAAAMLLGAVLVVRIRPRAHTPRA